MLGIVRGVPWRRITVGSSQSASAHAATTSCTKTGSRPPPTASAASTSPTKTTGLNAPPVYRE